MHDVASSPPWSPPIPEPVLELLQQACGTRVGLGRLSALMSELGDLPHLVHADPVRLTPYLGKQTATRFHAAAQLGLRAATQPVGEARQTPVHTPHDAARYLRAVFRGLVEEQVWVLLLDRTSRPLAVRHVSTGSDRTAVLDARQILRLAVHLRAESLVIGHNHPSGDCSPSPEDLRATRQLVAAGTIVGVRVADHLVFAGESWASFALQGLL